MKEDCRTLLKILTGKRFVQFTTRCNRAIQIALFVLKRLERETVLFQEEGGWLTYERFIRQADLTPIKMVTDDGLIHAKELDHYDMNAVLLLNSFAGYIALHDMDEIANACAKNNIVLINDVSGSIGLKQGKLGDVILGSFGVAKPVNLGTGGFIATDDEHIFSLIQEFEDSEPPLNFEALEKKLRGLEKRRSFLQTKARKVKEDLKQFDLVHREQEGLNVVVRFADETIKKQIEDYCKKSNLEYTICPREIRILDDAISIEIKRLE